ncbi:MAG: four helix bundle protein [Terracidiphilus sp.]
MARPKDYRDLIVWQKAMVLARSAYAATAKLPKSEAYGLLSQIRRAAVSVPSNIAEGHGRLTDLQFRHFLGNARGSIYELRTQFQLGADLGFIDRQSITELMDQSEEVTRLINGLLTSLQTGQSVRPFSSSASAASSARKGLH